MPPAVSRDPCLTVCGGLLRPGNLEWMDGNKENKRVCGEIVQTSQINVTSTN